MTFDPILDFVCPNTTANINININKTVSHAAIDRCHSFALKKAYYTKKPQVYGPLPLSLLPPLTPYPNLPRPIALSFAHRIHEEAMMYRRISRFVWPITYKLSQTSATQESRLWKNEWASEGIIVSRVKRRFYVSRYMNSEGLLRLIMKTSVDLARKTHEMR